MSECNFNWLSLERTSYSESDCFTFALWWGEPRLIFQIKKLKILWGEPQPFSGWAPPLWSRYGSITMPHEAATRMLIILRYLWIIIEAYMNINIYLMKKGELLFPSSWDFLVVLHLPNIFLLPFGIREILHIKCGKSEFLHIFMGLFKRKNVMLCTLPRLLKNGQTLKLSYCTLKNKQQFILQPSLRSSSMKGHSKEGFETF